MLLKNNFHNITAGELPVFFSKKKHRFIFFLISSLFRKYELCLLTTGFKTSASISWLKENPKISC